MNSNTAYPTAYHESCIQSDVLELNQQQSYFSPQWQDSPIEFNLDEPHMDFSLLQSPSDTDPASVFTLSRSSTDSSPCSSETTRQRSHESTPRQKQDRRRAQNRAAQRAYRERKEQLRQELEIQVTMWQRKHQALRESYVDQAEEVQKLKKHIDKLQAQLIAAQDARLPDNTTLCDFDMWPEFEWKAA